MLEGSHRLDRHQLNKLVAKRMSENPLWLSVACEELKLVSDHKKLLERIETLPDGLLEYVLFIVGFDVYFFFLWALCPTVLVSTDHEGFIAINAEKN